ncbi:hypothetical protein [Thalassobacillus sp. CUG 92003]|uniref:hypothetical protein n=1 Tax=Thalassobacillus sp. CUG 92003 TaxID=2736641 RepID=UPI0015E6F7D9|nr:hypothetical protein [Thalassobacillus sp. CUG 92003]
MLTNQDIQQFKDQLLEMKHETQEELDQYREKKANTHDPNDETGELSSVTDHKGNLGTEQFEQEKELTFFEQARERMMEIEDALDRIEKGTFGLSEKSGKPIPKERLEVAPTARFRVDES